MPLTQCGPLIKVSKRRPLGFFDPIDYGLDPKDETADQYEALQATIYAASVSTDTRKGGTIILPNAKMYISQGLEAPDANRGIRIVGSGVAPGGADGQNARPTLIWSDQAIHMLTFGDSSGVDWTGIQVENVAFADISTGRDQVLSAIRLIRQNNVRLKDVSIYRLEAGIGVYAPNVVGAGGGPQYVYIDNIDMKDCKFGIYQDDTVTTADWVLVGGVIDSDYFSGGIGIRQGNAGSMRIHGTNVQHHYTDFDLYRNVTFNGVRTESQSPGTTRFIDVRDGGSQILVNGMMSGGTTPTAEHIRIGTGCEKIFLIDWVAGSKLNINDGSDCVVVLGEDVWQEPLRRNAQAYGAHGDDYSDETTAIQAALDSYSTDGGEVKLPAGVYRVSAPLVVPNKVRLVGDGRDNTEIKAIGTFSGSYVVRLGESGDSNVFDCRLEDLKVNCGNLTGLTGVYSDSINEKSGVRNVIIKSVRYIGMHVEKTGTGSPQHFDIKDLEVLFNGSTVDGTAYGLFCESSTALANFHEIGNVTVNASVGGSIDAGVVLQGFSGYIHSIHGENMTDVLVIGTSTYQCANVVAAYISGSQNSDVTNVVSINNDSSQAITLLGIRPITATNCLVDNVKSITVTDSNGLAFYATGTGTAGSRAVLSSSPDVTQVLGSDIPFDFRGSMGDSTKDPTTDAPDDWLQIQKGGVSRYIPIYTAS